MGGFTKLFSSILTSSVWQEDDKTRLLWITMLASADKDGRVEAAIPGLAMLARISIEECEHALELLLSPDEYSRTTEHEGRRIEVIDGGWLVLNYRKYRDSGRPASRAPYYRKRRAEKKRNGGATVAQQEAENAQHPGVARNTRATSRIKRIAGAEAEAEAEKKKTEEVCPAPQADAGPAILIFPIKGKAPKEWNLTQTKLDEYAETFDGIDVLDKCKHARQWCVDNPAKRKTARGMGKFLFGWLERDNNRGRAAARPGTADDEWYRDNPTPTSEELRARGLFPLPEDGDSE